MFYVWEKNRFSHDIPMQVSLIVMLAVYNFGYNNFKSCNTLNVLSVSCVIYLFFIFGVNFLMVISVAAFYL